MRESTRAALKAITGQLHDNYIHADAFNDALKREEESKAALARFKAEEESRKAEIRKLAANGISKDSLRPEAMKSLLDNVHDTFEHNQREGRKVIAGVNDYLEKKKKSDIYDRLLGEANEKLEAARSRYEEAAAAQDVAGAMEATADIKRYEDQVRVFSKELGI